MTPINQTIYHHTDHLSGSNIDTDETGTVVEMTDYYPFGEVRLDQTTTAHKNNYKFTGKELDGDTGLYYYGARYYNPAIGRFASPDPWEGDLKDPQSLNKYSYVRNNPLRYVDPTGKFWAEAYDFVKSTVSNVINVVPNNVNYVKEFSIATYYVTKAVTSDDEQSYNENINQFVSHTAKMTDSAQKSLDGVATIGTVSLGAAEMFWKGGAAKGLEMMKNVKNPGAISQKKYLDEITNEKLQNIIKADYKTTGATGDGGVADAIRSELSTGNLTKNKLHFQKGQDLLNGYNKLLNSNKLSQIENGVATQLRDNILNALNGK